LVVTNPLIENFNNSQLKTETSSELFISEIPVCKVSVMLAGARAVGDIILGGLVCEDH